MTRPTKHDMPRTMTTPKETAGTPAAPIPVRTDPRVRAQKITVDRNSPRVTWVTGSSMKRRMSLGPSCDEASENVSTVVENTSASAVANAPRNAVSTTAASAPVRAINHSGIHTSWWSRGASTTRSRRRVTTKSSTDSSPIISGMTHRFGPTR